MEANMSINAENTLNPTELGLWLELGLGQSPNYGFTMVQLEELQLQSVIYKHFEAGIPVPCHLIAPMWKSVNFSGLYGSFMGCGGPVLHLKNRNEMDPEPGRCKRTDGKKWRCSKEAIDDQKYCANHINRAVNNFVQESH